MIELPMFPLEWVLLPGEELSLRIFEPRYVAMVGELMASGDPRFGVVLIARGREVGGGEQRNSVGALAQVTHCSELAAGRYALRCAVGERIRVSEWLADDPYPRAIAEVWPDDPGELLERKQLRDLQERVAALRRQLAESGQRGDPAGRSGWSAPAPDRALYSLAGQIPMGEADRYAVLAAPSSVERMAALYEAIDSVSARIEFGRPR